MATIFIIIVGLGILSKLAKITKDIIMSVLSLVVSLIGFLIIFRLFYKWIIVPLTKGITWIAKKIFYFLRWSGNTMNEHFKYRNDINFWNQVATSMDRTVV